MREGFSKRHIAFRLQRAPSTIIRELKRNKNRNAYFAKHAHKLARERLSPNPKTITQGQWEEVEKLLSVEWSPEQISSHIEVSLHSIYRYIYRDKRTGGNLFKYLRFKNQRKRKYRQPETRGQLTNRRNIKERPAIVEDRTRFGDLEIDTVVGKNHQHSLVSIVDRKTGYLWLNKCSNRKSEVVLKATIELLKPMKASLKTITADNGKEFSLHTEIAKELEIDFYFADPYSSWQRGMNENTNGLVRQYILKGSDLNDYSDQYIEEITTKLNHRPRKRLGFRSPSQVLFQEHGVALQMLI